MPLRTDVVSKQHVAGPQVLSLTDARLELEHASEHHQELPARRVVQARVWLATDELAEAQRRDRDVAQPAHGARVRLTQRQLELCEVRLTGRVSVQVKAGHALRLRIAPSEGDDTSNELSGKVAVVTGAASGIGRGVAERFLAEGARVVLADVNDEQGEAMATECGPDARFKQTDVSDQDQIRALVSFTVETFGGLHVMFNNAGISGARHPRLLDDDLADFHQVTAVNLLGVMAGTREAARHMSTHGGGSIINISSIAGVYGSTMMSHYGASKAAVINFTRALGMAWGRKGVRVNCIAPGPVETEGYLGVLTKQDPAAAKKAYDTVANRVGMGRWGKVEEIAYPCIFLASAASSFMTGETIVIDGGPAPQLGDG